LYGYLKVEEREGEKEIGENEGLKSSDFLPRC